MEGKGKGGWGEGGERGKREGEGQGQPLKLKLAPPKLLSWRRRWIATSLFSIRCIAVSYHTHIL